MSRPPNEKAAGEPGSSTIMVIEPEILVRMVIADYLRDCGYKVIEGISAEDVFLVLRAGGTVDIILAEVRLPGAVDGFSLASQIRRDHPEIDIILTSGVANAADKAGDLCDDGPLPKPYHPREVVRRINILRERRRSSKKRRRTSKKPTERGNRGGHYRTIAGS
jgi:DNA-binding response OmpR family regulator